MGIVPNHACVEPSGLCCHPYLRNWNPKGGSDLMGLVYQLQLAFTKKPPVFAKRTNTSPTQQQQPQTNFGYPAPPSGQALLCHPNGYPSHPITQQPPHSLPPTLPSGYPSSQLMSPPRPQQYPTQTNGYPSQPISPPHPTPPQQYHRMDHSPSQQFPAITQTNTYNQHNFQRAHTAPAQNWSSGPVPPPTPQRPSTLPSTTSPSNIQTDNSGAPQKQELNHLIYSKAVDFSNSIKMDVAQFNLVHNRLKEGGEWLNNTIAALKDQKGKLDEHLSILRQKDEEITKWLDEHESVELNIDEAFVPADPLSEQIHELVAEETTLEDTLYHLDQALAKGVLPLEDFVKITRSLSREQFQKRALALKIFNQQS
eukprot:CAMPEP_0174271046 /NCGR_PEP_ID=MMETSP0439-20130205/46598_1 /TAXON_ID=0 /ORGANISM="Stereomyxa ramosa, Strain Chinc5" /LENGTH=367 /DNA_ID=CAMNT_0015360789 /DNA_START=228 /DNA_END=1328 /DNA_ORIENTATION=+